MSKLQNYLRISADPAKAVMQATSEMEKQIESFMKEMKLELKENMMEEMEKCKKEMDPNMEKMIKNVLKDIRGEKGDSIKGDPGYTPIKGKDYFDGYTPIKGKDYFDGEKGRNPIFIGKNQPLNPQKGDLWYQD